MIEKISTLRMSREEWLNERHNGVGGSDVSSILGLNPFKSAAELFYDKVLRLNNTEENVAMFFGKQLEDKIAELWQYWDTDAKSMIDNYNAGNVKRRCKRMNAILRNPEFPWLLANLDRVIDKGILEIKTVSGWAANQWLDGIPPYYLIQLQTYLLITGYEYGEIAILKDGRYMEVIPFSIEKEITDKIIERTKTFWDNVTAARSLMLPYTSYNEINSFNDFLNLTLSEEVKHELAELEPAPDDSIAYENYLKIRYRIEPITIQGTADQLMKAALYMDYRRQINVLEDKMRDISNNLKNEMKTAEILDFGINGKIVHKENVKGIKTFNVKLIGGNK